MNKHAKGFKVEERQKGDQEAIIELKQFATARINNFTLELIGGSSLLLQGYPILVNAANENLVLGSGIAGEIRQRAGEQVQIECQNFLRENKISKIPSGFMCWTGAYNLTNFTYIFHTVGPTVQNNQVTDQNKLDLFNSIQVCIYQAIQLGLYSIVIPGISCGIFGYPVKEATEGHYSALFYMANNYPEVQFRVCFCLYKKPELREFYNFLREKFTSFDSVHFYEDNI